MTASATNGPAPPSAPADPATLLRSREYLRLLVIAAVLGVPISAVAYWFLVLTGSLGDWLYTDLPKALELDPAPAWWPLPLLGVAGLLVGLVIHLVPGRGGESPLDGFHPGGGAPGGAAGGARPPPPPPTRGAAGPSPPRGPWWGPPPPGLSLGGGAGGRG